MKSELQSPKFNPRPAASKMKPTRFCCRLDLVTSPSIRMNVTPTNRGALRLLRAAELEAWEEPSELRRW